MILSYHDLLDGEMVRSALVEQKLKFRVRKYPELVALWTALTLRLQGNCRVNLHGRGPVYDLQPGNLAEVGEVFAKRGRVMGENDGRDLQVHGSDADTRAAEPMIFDAGPLVEIQDEDLSEAVEMSLQPGVCSLDIACSAVTAC